MPKWLLAKVKPGILAVLVNPERGRKFWSPCKIMKVKLQAAACQVQGLAMTGALLMATCPTCHHFMQQNYEDKSLWASLPLEETVLPLVALWVGLIRAFDTKQGLLSQARNGRGQLQAQQTGQRRCQRRNGMNCSLLPVRLLLELLLLLLQLLW